MSQEPWQCPPILNHGAHKHAHTDHPNHPTYGGAILVGPLTDLFKNLPLLLWFSSCLLSGLLDAQQLLVGSYAVNAQALRGAVREARARVEEKVPPGPAALRVEALPVARCLVVCIDRRGMI